MKIAIIGSKGIPANYGGYETFAEKISLLFSKDHEALVIGDASNKFAETNFLGINIINSKYLKSSNPLFFYHDSLVKAEKWGADCVVMCGIGGVFSTPFFNASKMKIFVNPDGLGFKRDKWVWWKKLALYVQFGFSAVFSNYLICDSEGIAEFFKDKLKRKRNVFVAEYGSQINPFIKDKEEVSAFNLEEFNVQKNNYYLVVSRLEPENNVITIIKGYLNSQSKIPLIIVGNTNTVHANELMKYKSDLVHFVGGVYDQKKLSELRFGCKAYFHGHSVGGTNPSLLEAMGSKNLTIAHENVFNREVLDNEGLFFHNEQDVSKHINYVEESFNDEEIESYKMNNLDRVINYYSWPNISDKYLKIFHDA